MRLVSTILVVLAAAMVLLLGSRWIQRRDPRAGLIVQLGLVLRLWAGVSLFWISYLHLPLLDQLQHGGGFWLLAPDARTYFEIAARAADGGPDVVPGVSPSPAFTRALGLWMFIVGVSPASGLLLNVLAYLAVAALIVGFGTRNAAATFDGTRLVPLAAFSFSPALVLFGTQTLKDQFFCLTLTAACAGAWMLFRAFSTQSPREAKRSGAVGLLIITGTTYLLAGIRPYAGFLVAVTLALVLSGITLRQWPQLWFRNSLLVIGVLLVLWIPFRLGAGPHYDDYRSRLLRIAGISGVAPLEHTPVLGDLASAREAFVEAGGATNIVNDVEVPAHAGWFAGARVELGRLLTGVALLVVPVSVLQWMSVVELRGGRGLLLFTDVDTSFLGLTILGVILALVRSWRAGRVNWPCVLFVALLCVELALMMSYVVTNFGTLFRLRIMAASLFWLLPIAAIQPGVCGREQTEQDSRLAHRSQPWHSKLAPVRGSRHG